MVKNILNNPIIILGEKIINFNLSTKKICIGLLSVILFFSINVFAEESSKEEKEEDSVRKLQEDIVSMQENSDLTEHNKSIRSEAYQKGIGRLHSGSLKVNVTDCPKDVREAFYDFTKATGEFRSAMALMNNASFFTKNSRVAEAFNAHDEFLCKIKELFAVIQPYIDRGEARKTLDYSFKDMTYDEVSVLAEGLKDNTSLEKLDLNCNHIGDAGAQVLAKALKYNTSLKMLNLSGDSGHAEKRGDVYNIGATGAQALADALVHNTSLEKLDLDFNNIGDAGAQALAEALKHNVSLRVLGLYGNNIGNVGAQALAEALKHNNTSLETLSLDEKLIDEAVCQAIDKALQQNRKFK